MAPQDQSLALICHISKFREATNSEIVSHHFFRLEKVAFQTGPKIFALNSLERIQSEPYRLFASSPVRLELFI